MAKYELTPAALTGVSAAQDRIRQSLLLAASRLRDAARSLDYDGNPFGRIPDELSVEFRRLHRQVSVIQVMSTVLDSAVDTYAKAEQDISCAAGIHRQGSSTGGESGAEHGGRNNAGSGSGKKTSPSAASKQVPEKDSRRSKSGQIPPRASVEADQTNKTRSPEQEAGENTREQEQPGCDNAASENGTAGSVSSAALPDASEIAGSVTSSMDHRPYSAPVFSAMSTTDRSAWLAAVASSLYTQFPQLSLSGSSQVSFPLGNGMTAYSSVSVSGSRESSSKVKISQALDANTGLLREGISISDDGSTVSFTKNGVSTSVKTDTGTWKIDSTSLSRTSGARLDPNTYCSFTEKVDARGYVSMEESVTTKSGGLSASTTIGLKTSDTGQSAPSAVPVTSPAAVTVPAGATSPTGAAQQKRINSYVEILTGGLAGGLAGFAAGPMAIPVPVPVF